MSELILQAEAGLRLGVFATVFALLCLWELLSPRRPRPYSRRQRWPGNLGVMLVNTLVLRLLFPTAAVGVALLLEGRQAGLLGWLQAPAWAEVVLALVALDLAIYLQHVLFHAVPVLWRLHRMHHADLDLDVTSGARFHPLEILLSMLIKLAVIAALGAPAVAVLLFEVLLNASSMFNHSNVYIPPALDRILRWLIVTPDMHRVHHSVVPAETNSNFGFNLPWWDRLLGTYRADARAGQLGLTIGLEQFRDATELRLDRMLWQPWRGGTGRYPLAARGRRGG